MQRLRTRAADRGLPIPLLCVLWDAGGGCYFIEANKCKEVMNVEALAVPLLLSKENNLRRCHQHAANAKTDLFRKHMCVRFHGATKDPRCDGNATSDEKRWPTQITPSARAVSDCTDPNQPHGPSRFLTFSPSALEAVQTQTISPAPVGYGGLGGCRLTMRGLDYQPSKGLHQQECAKEHQWILRCADYLRHVTKSNFYKEQVLFLPIHI